MTTPVNEQRVGELVSLDYYFARLRERLAGLSDDAIAQLEAAYATWTALVASVPEDQWWEPMGPVAGPFASDDRVAFVVHIMDELIHHSAEVALLRDLYRSGAELTS